MDVLAAVFAVLVLYGVGGKLVVLSGQFQCVLGKFQLHQSAALVAEYAHTLQSACQCLTVCYRLEGVVCGDYAVVVGISSFNQAEVHYNVIGLYARLVAVKLYLNVACVLAEYGFQNGGNLLGQDESGLESALDVVHDVAHQLASVCAGKGERFGFHVHIDAVHHQSHLIVGGGEQAVVDTLQQGLGWHGKGCAFFLYGAWNGIGGGILCHYAERAAVVVAFDAECFGAELNGQGLFGQFLDGVHDGLCGNAEACVLALFEQGNLGDEIFFAVRCGDGDGVVFYIEEETIKNGH